MQNYYNKNLNNDKFKDILTKAWIELGKDETKINEISNKVFSTFEKFFLNKKIGTIIMSQYKSNLYFKDEFKEMDEITESCFNRIKQSIPMDNEYVNETREILAMARVRQQTGKCGNEEVRRWAGEVSEAEKKLLSMKAEYDNIKIHINKLLYRDQKEQFVLNPLTATDPAFFTSELHIIDHVRTPEKLAKFTDMLVAEVIYMSPETTKLKAAIAMKKAEISNYAQKFIMPNAKLSVDYVTQFDRFLPYEQVGKGQMQQINAPYPNGYGMYNPYGSPYLDKNYARFFIAAQWKPIEGGTKIAEIARAKAELNELNAYLEQVNTELEMNVRSVVNRAIAKYFIIEKSYKAMFAEAENYQMVKAKYLMGTAPINQIADAQHMYFGAKVDAMNSQNEFFTYR